MITGTGDSATRSQAGPEVAKGSQPSLATGRSNQVPSTAPISPLPRSSGLQVHQHNTQQHAGVGDEAMQTSLRRPPSQHEQHQQQQRRQRPPCSENVQSRDVICHHSALPMQPPNAAITPAATRSIGVSAAARHSAKDFSTGGDDGRGRRGDSASGLDDCGGSRDDACDCGDEVETWEPVATEDSWLAAVSGRSMQGAGSAGGAARNTAASTAVAVTTALSAFTEADGLIGSSPDVSSRALRHYPQVLLPPLLVCMPPPSPPLPVVAEPAGTGSAAATAGTTTGAVADSECGNTAVVFFGPGALPGLLLGASPPCSSALGNRYRGSGATAGATAASIARSTGVAARRGESGGGGSSPKFLHVPPAAKRQLITGMVPSPLVCLPDEGSTLLLLAGGSQTSATPRNGSNLTCGLAGGGGGGGGDWMPSGLAALALTSYRPAVLGYADVGTALDGDAAAAAAGTASGGSNDEGSVESGDLAPRKRTSGPWVVWGGPTQPAMPAGNGMVGLGSAGRRWKSSEAIACSADGGAGAGAAFAGPRLFGVDEACSREAASRALPGLTELPLQPEASGSALRTVRSNRMSPASQGAVDAAAAAAAVAPSGQGSTTHQAADSAPADVASSGHRAKSAAAFFAATAGGAQCLLKSISGFSLDSPGRRAHLLASGKGIGGAAVVPLPAGCADGASQTTECCRKTHDGTRATGGAKAGVVGLGSNANSSTESAVLRWQRAARAAGLAAGVARSFRTLRNQHDENLVREEQLKMLGEIGTGTFARVDKCLYSPPNGASPFLVAVKRIKPEMLQSRSEDDNDLQLFIQEAQLLRKLNHPHIVEYVGLGIVTDSSQPVRLDELGTELRAPASASRVREDRNQQPESYGTRFTCQGQSCDTPCPHNGGLRQRRRSSGDFILQRDRGLAATAVPVVLPVLQSVFIVEEYMGGGTLKNAVYQQMLQPQHQLYSNATALRWMAQLAGALSYMHTCRPKVLHRDIKLDNVLLTSCAVSDSLNGCAAKLGDLGLAALISEHRLERLGGNDNVGPEHLKIDLSSGSFATRKHSEMSQAVRQRVLAAAQAPPHLRAVDSAVRQRVPKMLESHKRDRLGTYMYMAPEVYRRQKYDEKCDCFSFAMVLYEVFHRYIVACSLEAPSEMEKYACQVAHGFRPIIHEDLPFALRRAIKQCWAQDPAARPDMADVARELWSLDARGVLAALDTKQQGATMPQCCCVIS